jgi:hypothetical protein
MDEAKITANICDFPAKITRPTPSVPVYHVPLAKK